MLKMMMRCSLPGYLRGEEVPMYTDTFGDNWHANYLAHLVGDEPDGHDDQSFQVLAKLFLEDRKRVL
jgi:hypothetical protein